MGPWPSREVAAVRPPVRLENVRAILACSFRGDGGDWSPERGREKLTPWQDGARASPRVLVLGAHAALRVRGGALEIEHGPHDDRATIRIDIDAEPKPHTILFDSHGEFLTGEAIRWCARYSINLLLPGARVALSHWSRARSKQKRIR